MAGAQRRALQDGVLGCRPVRLVQQCVSLVGGGLGKSQWVLGVVPAHAQAVLKPPQSICLTFLAAPAGTALACSRSACRRR